MTDKEIIIAEIERLLNSFPKPHGEIQPIDQNAYNLLGDVKTFIEALYAEKQPSKELEKDVRDAAYSYYVKVYYDTNCRFNPDWDDVKDAFVSGANWQKGQIMKNVVETKVRGRIDGKGIFIDSDIPIGIDVNEDDKVKILIIKEDEQ